MTNCAMSAIWYAVLVSQMDVEVVADYVRTEWSASHGVEVQATGVRSLTLALPPELLGMTELCVELWNRFEAETDFKHTPAGATITVWVPPSKGQPAVKGSSIAGTLTAIAAACAAVAFVWADAVHEWIDVLVNATRF
jgi:hypothetical protein